MTNEFFKFYSSDRIIAKFLCTALSTRLIISMGGGEEPMNLDASSFLNCIKESFCAFFVN